MKDDLNKFFSEMRKEDEKKEVPSFEKIISKSKATSNGYGLQLGIAASVLLASFLFLNREKEEAFTNEDAIVIEFSNDTPDMFPVILEEPTLDTWESPTAILMEDFADF